MQIIKSFYDVSVFIYVYLHLYLFQIFFQYDLCKFTCLEPVGKTRGRQWSQNTRPLDTLTVKSSRLFKDGSRTPVQCSVKHSERFTTLKNGGLPEKREFRATAGTNAFIRLNK